MQFRSNHVANRNPWATKLSIFDGDQMVSAQQLPASRSLRLRLVIPSESRESYLRFDPTSQTLVQTAETLRASRLSAAGELYPGSDFRHRWFRPIAVRGNPVDGTVAERASDVVDGAAR